MWVMLATVSVTLIRTIRPHRRGIRVTYAAYIDSSVAVPLLWCAHPLFTASDGEEIVVDGPFIEHFLSFGTIHNALPKVSMLPPKRALKSFGLFEVASAAIRLPDGLALHMSWAGSPIRALALYLDNGLFNGNALFEIEPGTGRHDLADALWSKLPVVTTHVPLKWALNLRLGQEKEKAGPS